MALVTNITKRVDIPHEPDQWMEFKKLNWKQLEHASDISTDASMVKMKQIGGDLLKVFTESVKEQQADPSKKYDRDYILQKGISKWSYDAEVKPDNISDLDEETAAWAFKEIISLNLPRTEDEVKNV